MGLIKFEVEIPEFDKELSITVVLKKDGTVVESVSSTPIPEPQAPEKPKKVASKKKNDLLGGGNMMNIEL